MGKSNKVENKKRATKNGNKKNASKSVDASTDSTDSKTTYSSAEGLECPKCGCDIITKSGPRDKKCTVCRHKWV